VGLGILVRGLEWLPGAYRTLLLQVFLIFGRSGWIGGLVGDYLKEKGAKFEYATARLEDRSSILADIERVRRSSGISMMSCVSRMQGVLHHHNRQICHFIIAVYGALLPSHKHVVLGCCACR
jgi:hypothetical protein